LLAIEFEDLYIQLRVNFIDGRKDDGRLADYSHYYRLRLSTGTFNMVDDNTSQDGSSQDAVIPNCTKCTSLLNLALMNTL